jgi:hypothetical protein
VSSTVSDRYDDIQAQLARLADGALPAAARERLLAQVRDSPELARELETQRDAVALLRRLEDVRAPASLQRSIEALQVGARPPLRARPPRRVQWRLRPVVALALASTVVAATILALTAAHSGAPTVLAASQLALRPATLPAPAESPRANGVLVSSVDGIPYPYWGGSLGWRTAGARTDRLDGRTITTVFYADSAARRIGYAIVAGRALPLPGGAVVSRRGVTFHVLTAAGGVTIVTWRRSDHTCILAARRVDAGTLMQLATWG